MSPEAKWLERLADEAVARGITDVTYDYAETAIGRLLIARSDEGVCRVAFAEEQADSVLDELAGGIGARVVRSKASLEEVNRGVSTYLEGAAVALDFPVDLALTHSDFRRAVLARLRAVPRGAVVTYGELAGRTGHPRAARAVGSACATNPVPIIVPCHRVVPAGGGVGSYGGGPDRKRFLLELEGAL
ncbi:MAG: methylated-DNA--[protein]-cysteine S-methyltransferase [Actinomycetota bacterium]